MEPHRTMAPQQSPNKNHKDIPGNPSTATSSIVTLNDRSNGQPLKVLTEEDWRFWIHNGYVVIRNAVPVMQVMETADFLWEFEEKDPRRWEQLKYDRAELSELGKKILGLEKYE